MCGTRGFHTGTVGSPDDRYGSKATILKVSFAVHPMAALSALQAARWRWAKVKAEALAILSRPLAF
jgi:hypothetical protein